MRGRAILIRTGTLFLIGALIAGWPPLWTDPHIPSKSEIVMAANTPGDYMIRVRSVI